MEILGTILHHENFSVPGWRLNKFARAEKDLDRAKSLIARLRTENQALRIENRRLEAERSEMISYAETVANGPTLRGNLHKWYGAKMVWLALKHRFANDQS